MKATKPPIVNQQIIAYSFQCDLCDAGIYVTLHKRTFKARSNGHDS